MRATNFVNNVAAWARAGWSFDANRKIILDAGIILGDDRAPKGEAKQEHQTVEKRDKIGKRKVVPKTSSWFFSKKGQNYQKKKIKRLNNVFFELLCTIGESLT